MPLTSFKVNEIQVANNVASIEYTFATGTKVTVKHYFPDGIPMDDEAMLQFAVSYAEAYEAGKEIEAQQPNITTGQSITIPAPEQPAEV